MVPCKISSDCKDLLNVPNVGLSVSILALTWVLLAGLICFSKRLDCQCATARATVSLSYGAISLIGSLSVVTAVPNKGCKHVL